MRHSFDITLPKIVFRPFGALYSVHYV